MYALVKNNNIIKHFAYPKGFEHDGNLYSSDVFNKWTNDERKAIGLYKVIIDKTNYKDPAYYNNTNSTYTFANDQVTESWGTATAKQLEDSLWTQEDLDNGDLPSDKSVGDVKVEGLKTEKKRIVKQQASGLLEPTDWYVIKATDVTDYNVPSNITTFRANVRTKSNEMETQIDACTTVDELKSLYEYTEQDDGSFTRPLPEFPTLEN